MKKAARVIALHTYANEEIADMPALLEEGGIYPRRVKRIGRNSEFRDFREADETDVVACARCGLEFAGTDDSSALENLHRHINGDEECPSICGQMATSSRR